MGLQGNSTLQALFCVHLTRNTEVDTADFIFQNRKMREVSFARDDIVR